MDAFILRWSATGTKLKDGHKAHWRIQIPSSSIIVLDWEHASIFAVVAVIITASEMHTCTLADRKDEFLLTYKVLSS